MDELRSTTKAQRPKSNRNIYDTLLAEKQRRAGSDRTVQSYARMLRHFFGTIGGPPDRVASQDLFACAYGAGFSGKPLS